MSTKVNIIGLCHLSEFVDIVTFAVLVKEALIADKCIVTNINEHTVMLFTEIKSLHVNQNMSFLVILDWRQRVFRNVNTMYVTQFPTQVDVTGRAQHRSWCGFLFSSTRATNGRHPPADSGVLVHINWIMISVRSHVECDFGRPNVNLYHKLKCTCHQYHISCICSSIYSTLYDNSRLFYLLSKTTFTFSVVIIHVH